MHEMRTIAIDDPLTWASVSLSVCHRGDCSYSFGRWRHFDAAITVAACSDPCPMQVYKPAAPESGGIGGDGSVGSGFADDLEHSLSATLDEFYGTRRQSRDETRQATSKCVVKQRHCLARSYPH